MFATSPWSLAPPLTDRDGDASEKEYATQIAKSITQNGPGGKMASPSAKLASPSVEMPSRSSGGTRFYDLIHMVVCEYKRLEVEVTKLHAASGIYHVVRQGIPSVESSAPFPDESMWSDSAHITTAGNNSGGDLPKIPVTPRGKVVEGGVQGLGPEELFCELDEKSMRFSSLRNVLNQAAMPLKPDVSCDVETDSFPDVRSASPDERSLSSGPQVNPTKTSLVILPAPTLTGASAHHGRPFDAGSGPHEAEEHLPKINNYATKLVSIQEVESAACTIRPSSPAAAHISIQESESVWKSVELRPWNPAKRQRNKSEGTSSTNSNEYQSLKTEDYARKQSMRQIYTIAPEETSGIRRHISNMIQKTWFDMLIGIIICADGIILGMEAENRLRDVQDNKHVDRVINSFSISVKLIFTFELFLRFYALGMVKALRESGWIRFDVFLVMLAWVDIIIGALGSWVDTSFLANTTVLRIFRLARLSRAARLMVQLRTLWLLISGLKASLSTMLWTWILITAIGYIFAIVGMETIPPKPGEMFKDDMFNRVAIESFGSLADSMLTLLQFLTLDSINVIYRPLIMDGTQGYFCAAYFLLFIFIVSIALMNLVTAVMVEGSLKQASEDKDAQRAFEEQRKKKLLPRLHEIFTTLDDDGSGEVSWNEINTAPEFVKNELRALSNNDDLRSIFELLDDDDSGSVQIDEFLDGIFKASSGDVILKLQMARLVRQVTSVKAIVEGKERPPSPKKERPVTPH